jgi:uncharacterized protein YceK
MKMLSRCLLVACLLATSGCISATLVANTKATTRYDRKTKKDESVPGHPALYALLPLSIPLDIVTLPFQPFFLMGVGGH